MLYISFQIDAEITDVDDAISRSWSTTIGPATVQSAGLLADYFLKVHDALLPPRLGSVPLTSQTDHEEQEELPTDLQGDLESKWPCKISRMYFAASDKPVSLSMVSTHKLLGMQCPVLASSNSLTRWHEFMCGHHAEGYWLVGGCKVQS